jgi:hypothetical protein
MQSGPTHSKILERWSRLYADVRASSGRAAIQAAILNGGASVALLAVLRNLAIAQQTKGITENFVTFGAARSGATLRRLNQLVSRDGAAMLHSKGRRAHGEIKLVQENSLE